MATLRTRLFLTLAYSSTFGFPLTASEWARRLYQRSNESIEWPTTNRLRDEIVALVDGGWVAMLGRYFVAKSDETRSLEANVRGQRRQAARRKLQEITPVIRLCERLPWVAGLAVTGSVAVDNAEQNCDVDFMVVCAKNRLWMVRPILILFSQWYGKRRTWRGEEQNSWCFNLWLEQYSMRVPSDNQSLYTAYEVCQARWVVDKNNTRELFFFANRWANHIVPRMFLYAKNDSITPQPTRGFAFPVVANLFDLANCCLFTLQKWYMRAHMTREHVSLASAAFHPRDTKGMIFERITNSI